MVRPVTFTLEVGGPFKVQSKPYLLKGADRKPPLTGEQVRPVKVVARIGDSEMPVEAVADGQGLGQKDKDRLLEHDTDPCHMRVTPADAKVDYLEFDLGRAVSLDLMEVWNYNETDRTQWGLRQADLAVWTEGDGWREVKQAVQFDEAEGAGDYDQPTLTRLDGVAASKVRLQNLAGFEGSNRVGLAEVQFFASRTAKANNPEPADGSVFRDQATGHLAWSPGDGIARQRIYMALDANELTCIGEVKADVSEVDLSPLANDRSYRWRIDGIRSDGSVATGDAWSFTTTALAEGSSLDGPVQTAGLPRLLLAAVAAEAVSPSPMPAGQGAAPALAAEAVPAKLVTRRLSISPIVLAGVVALAGILGIVVLTRQQRQRREGTVDRTAH